MNRIILSIALSLVGLSTFAQQQYGTVKIATNTGSNAYVAGVTGWTPGGITYFGTTKLQFSGANTGSATLAINGGPLGIKKLSGGMLVNLVSGDIVDGYFYDITYNGTIYVIDLPGATTTATVTTRNNLPPAVHTSSFTLAPADTSKMHILSGGSGAIVITMGTFSGLSGKGLQFAFRRDRVDTVYFATGSETIIQSPGATLGVADSTFAYLYYNGTTDKFYLANGGSGGGGSTLIDGNGTTANGSAVDLGGSVTSAISLALGASGNINISPTSDPDLSFGIGSSGMGLQTGGATLFFDQASEDITFTDNRGSPKGFLYQSDYSATMPDLALIHKGYVDDAIAGVGGGTVTSVSVTTANGVSGSVATATTTPAISVTLGAITPTSVNGVVVSGSSTPTLAVTGTSTISGTHSGTSSGTNTGDQTTSGTTGRVTVTNGSTNPAIDISSSYVGQTSINTLGTVTTGTWDAAPIGATQGGTAQTSWTTGQMLIATGSNTLGKLTTGSGVSTALAVNTGSAGAFVVNGGPLGTPSSGSGANLTGTASGLTAGNVTINANLTGDVTSVGNAATVVKINGTSMSGLATGILKNTTSTGVPSIAVAGDFPTLNQSTTGSAATLTTSRKINQVSFNGSADIKLNGRSTKTASYSIVSTDVGTTIIGNPTSDITFTIDALAADDYVSILNKGSATILFSAGTASVSGLVSLAPGLSALIYWDLSNAVQIFGGNTGTSGFTVIHSQVGSVATSGATETDLYTYTLPAGTLGVAGESTTLRASGNFANTINNKRIRIYFGASTIFDSGALAITSANSWTINATVVRATGTTQRVMLLVESSSALFLLTNTTTPTAAETLSGTVVFRITGQGTASSDITCEVAKLHKEGF